MKKHIITAAIFLFFFSTAWGQTSINIYHPSDDTLKKFCYDFIEGEKAYDYYSDDCMFFLHILCVDTVGISFIFESGLANENSLIKDDTILMSKDGEEILVMKLDSHYFYTYIKKCTNSALPLTPTEDKLYVKTFVVDTAFENNLGFVDEEFESHMCVHYINGKYRKINHYYRTYGKLR